MIRKLLPVNENPVDRALRVVFGLVLLGFALAGYGAWGYLGIVPLLTGLAGSCPAYTLLGLSTCPLKAIRKTT